MRPFSKSFAALAAGVLLVGALGCSRTETEDARGTVSFSSQGTGKGDSPRRFSDAATARSSIQLLDLDGQAFDLWSAARPPVTVVVFTRSDCPISNRLAPEIRHLYELYQPQGVAFYLVYVDPSESPEAIRQHLREYNYPCPGLRDPQHTLVDFCQATTTPEAVVFNRDRTTTYRGRINNLYEDLGRPRAEATTHELADAIEATLQGRPIAAPYVQAVGCRIADLRS